MKGPPKGVWLTFVYILFASWIATGCTESISEARAEAKVELIGFGGGILGDLINLSACPNGQYPNRFALMTRDGRVATFRSTNESMAKVVGNELVAVSQGTAGLIVTAGSQTQQYIVVVHGCNTQPPTTLTQCNNGFDDADPEDNLADAADPGCHTDGNAGNPNSYNPNDNDETNSTTNVTQCNNGFDDADPEDNLADAADPGCHTDGNANNPASYNPQDNDETNSTTGPNITGINMNITWHGNINCPDSATVTVNVTGTGMYNNAANLTASGGTLSVVSPNVWRWRRAGATGTVRFTATAAGNASVTTEQSIALNCQTQSVCSINSINYSSADYAVNVNENQMAQLDPQANWPANCQVIWYTDRPNIISVNGADAVYQVEGVWYYAGQRATVRGNNPGTAQICARVIGIDANGRWSFANAPPACRTWTVNSASNNSSQNVVSEREFPELRYRNLDYVSQTYQGSK